MKMSARRNLRFAPGRPFLSLLLAIAVLLFPAVALRAQVSPVWSADQGDGTYKNPILFADYSDPDVIRDGDTFYLVASSFNQIPGLPILASNDLVHWRFAAHALAVQPPAEIYRTPQHGKGVWAPSIRRHNGSFFLFYPDPDRGIYMIRSATIEGPWSPPLLIKAAPGWIDPCPFWDDDGNAWLVNAVAASRGGVKNIIILSRMAPDGTALLDFGTIIVDGHATETTTLEGPKIYKRNGFYYLSAPAGGVPNGYQVVFRSQKIYGPYERRVVLAQGATTINGPHQGAWVDTPAGEDWFVHFRDLGPYGRVVYLEPMHWQDDWPVIGRNISAAGTGEPVASFRKPKTLKAVPISTLPDSDEFNGPTLGPQWQWEANPQPDFAFPMPNAGAVRLIAEPASTADVNLANLPNLLLQKFPGPSFTVTTCLTFTPHAAKEETGLIVLGRSYGALMLYNAGDHLELRLATRLKADEDGPETLLATIPLSTPTLSLRATVDASAQVHFAYSEDNVSFKPIGSVFQATAGRWVGARIGLFASGKGVTGELGYADYDYFRFSR